MKHNTKSLRPGWRAASAAVLYEKDGPFVIDQIGVGPPRADEVLVRIVATGICHTDLNVRAQRRPMSLPAVLGHEGAGVVEAVGTEVEGIDIGDRVLLSYLSCGGCPECQSDHPASCCEFNRLCFAHARPDGSHALCNSDGGLLHDRFFGQSSFATYAIAHTRCVVKAPGDIPLELLAPLGCGVMTGAGAVWNELALGANQSLAVFGTGAVGLSAIMAAVVSGASTIIATDIVSARLELAQKLGATHVIDARREPKVSDAIRTITGDGVDHVLDTTGQTKVIEDGFSALRQRGTLGLVACADRTESLHLPHLPLLTGCKRVIGIVEGGGSAESMIARIIGLYRQGRFPFDQLVTTYSFADINQAVRDCETGTTIKPVLIMPEIGSLVHS